MQDCKPLWVLHDWFGNYDVQIAKDCYPKPLMTVTLRPEGGVPARMVKR